MWLVLRKCFAIGQSDDCAVSNVNPYEGYSIPDEQERIDNLVDQTGSLLE